MNNAYLKNTSASLIILTSIFVSGKTHAGGPSGEFIPKSVEVLETYILVRVDADVSGADACTDKKTIALQPSNHQVRSEMLSVALTSIASNKKMGGWVSECIPAHWNSSITFPRLSTVFYYRD